MSTKNPGGSQSEHGNKTGGSGKTVKIGENISFAAKEAFNLLRTNLTLSFADTKGARIIGVTSSFRGEGKSFVSANLAISLAEANARVLLLEGDLRLPTMAKILDVNRTPGVSNILTGSINDVTEALQRHVCGSRLDVITSGDIPPNPSELLGSDRMKSLMELLSHNYEYIIFDLPPVTAVPDPIVVTPIVDGIILVVRHEYADKKAIQETMRQLRVANAKILGFVYNGNDSDTKKYSKKYYKGRYKRYYSNEYTEDSHKQHTAE